MNRLALTLLLGAATTLAAQQPSTESRGSAPNVVFILADDMGWGDPAFGRDDACIPTPRLDGLAAAGMRFVDAHSPAALCVPARYGLLTGRYPARKRRLSPDTEAVIAADTPTLPGILRRAGYRTHMVGKWHLGFDHAAAPDYAALTGGPLDRGFDGFFGIPASLDIPPYYFIRDRRAVAPPTVDVAASSTPGWSPIQGAFWRDGRMAAGFEHAAVLPGCGDEAVAVIRAHAARGEDDPLFLYLALPAPHTPWLPHEEFEGRSQAGLYGDFVAEVDAVVGRVLDALEAAGMRDDTLVLFSSDNGPVWYQHDTDRYGHSATGPFRGMKADSFEGGHRVPFVARWPGHVAAGARC
ncbi:MAG: sulfatase-like hydrolase/transferase, partial [Planctomycetes bacterium]|nr:sulfatase-like hydrolase/transferase [Planctomycetota bacterium]